MFTADWSLVWWNTMWSAMHGDPAVIPTAERNLARALFGYGAAHASMLPLTASAYVPPGVGHAGLTHRGPSSTLPEACSTRFALATGGVSECPTVVLRCRARDVRSEHIQVAAEFAKLSASDQTAGGGRTVCPAGPRGRRDGTSQTTAEESRGSPIRANGAKRRSAPRAGTPRCRRTDPALPTTASLSSRRPSCRTSPSAARTAPASTSTTRTTGRDSRFC
ncbi:hypothetical protein ACWDWU_01650 [Streptomyces sp. NPDC003442]